MSFARPPSAPISLKMKDKKLKDSIFCEKNYSDTVKLPIDNSPVKLIVIKFKINFKSDVHLTFGHNIY